MMHVTNGTPGSRSNKLTVGSYNCEHAGDTRLPFIRRLFKTCDFLCIQEHGLFKSQLDWFDKIDNWLAKHGISAMDETKALRGRPHGGVAILWNSTLANNVVPVQCESKRICAVIIQLAGNAKMLLICVYMPCDDRRADGNLNEYIDTLNEIEILCNSAHVNQICIGGDFNTDLNRNTHQTRKLIEFLSEQGYSLCVDDPCSGIVYTFCSKGSGARSLIDHFILSDNLMPSFTEYESVDDVDNFSDHVAIKCVFDYTVYHTPNQEEMVVLERLAWQKADENDIQQYKSLLDQYLNNIVIPYNAVACTSSRCTEHTKDIVTFYDNIFKALSSSGKEAIPIVRRPTCSSVPGWNEHVREYFTAALFWHNIWIDNGRPLQGVVSEIRRHTRREYHRVYKMTMRHAGTIASNKMAQAIRCNSMTEFWKEVKAHRKRKVNYPSTVDGVHGDDGISEIFASKYNELYNVVSYNDVDINALQADVDQAIINACEQCSHCCTYHTHDISAGEVAEAIIRLKQSKRDGSSEVMSDHLLFVIIYYDAAAWCCAK